MILSDMAGGCIARVLSLATWRALIAGSLSLAMLPGLASGQPIEAVKEDPASETSSPSKGDLAPEKMLHSAEGLDIQQPVVKAVPEYREFRGKFEAVESVKLQTRASGALLKIHATAGARVRQGDLLFEMDSRIYVAEMRRAEAELARCEAQVRRRSLDLDRVQRLARSSAVSQQELDQVEAEVQEARAALEAARPLLELARLKLEATRVTSPIDGRFRRAAIAVGELVLEDKTVLGTVESVDPVEIRFAIDEATFLKLNRGPGRRGGAAEGVSDPRRDGPGAISPEVASERLAIGTEVVVGLSDEPNYPRRGRIDSIDTRLDVTTRTVQCRVLVPNPDGDLLPGMSARLQMLAGVGRAVLVPKEALSGSEFGSDDPRSLSRQILVVNENNHVKARRVTIGATHTDGFVVIEFGLKKEEKFVVPFASPPNPR